MTANSMNLQDTMVTASGSTWSTWREALQVARHPAHVRKTVTIALVIGTIFVAINQLPLILGGHADAVVLAKAIMTYLTPFCVSNYSILVATRASRPGREPAKVGGLPATSQPTLRSSSAARLGADEGRRLEMERQPSPADGAAGRASLPRSR